MAGKNESKIFEIRKYFAIALDPVHIGTGGYRIGRVDNTIIRDKATNIPKIPGTTINGVCRTYSYLTIKASKDESKNNANLNLACAKGKTVDGIEPCGSCDICITFGYASKNDAMQAMALFSDAQILFFPVATMIGPVWVTCPMVLEDLEIEIKNTGEKPQLNNIKYGEFIVPPDSELNIEDKLNFGWLLLYEKQNEKQNEKWNWFYKENDSYVKLQSYEKLNKILKRTVIVSNDLFVQIVNMNLEVRTSVSIDPRRGVAEDKALFTYEAIPRATVFSFDVTYQNPSHFPRYQNNSVDLSRIIKTVESGFKQFRYLGVGGMGSRGFGRIEILLNKGDKND